jgi:hypothetical protein
MSEQLHVTTSDATTKTCKIIQRWLSCQYDYTAQRGGGGGGGVYLQKFISTVVPLL